MLASLHWDKSAGLILVLAMHATVLYWLWSYQLYPKPQEAVTLFVNLINPPPPIQKKPEPVPVPPPMKVKLVKKVEILPPPQTILAANAPVVSPTEAVSHPPTSPAPEPIEQVPPGPSSPEPVVVAPPAPPEPVLLASDLALACPQRIPPEYPSISRRLMEQGRVVLRVELDETGRVTSARVKESSGFKRLDEAGLAAVKQWHCNTPLRNGQASRAIALQPFNFILEGLK